MKRIISLFSLFILLFVNIVTPVTYAMDGEDSSSESVSESTESSVDTDNSVGGGDDSSDTDASDDVASDEGTEPDADSESAEDTDADVTDEESSDEEGSDSTEGEELEESLENSASGSTDGDTSEEEVSAEEEIELLCKQEGAPENAHYLSSDEDASDVSCKWECDDHYAISEDGLSCTLVEEGLEDVVTDSKGNSEEVKSCEIPENAQKIESTGEKCEWECSQGYLITKAGDGCEEINFSKYKNEPSVDALCYKLGLSWAEEKGDLAKLAGIDDYVGSREQNESIRVYLVDHVEDILKGKFNIQEEVVEKNKGYVYTNDVVLNAEEIKGESTYNNITVNVEAPIGSFPEGTTLKIKPITKKKELKEIEDQIVTQQDNVDETLELLAFDISFFYDEKEVQPVEGKTVQVTFDYAENKKLTEADSNENKELKVYHLDDKDENGNKVEEVEVKEVEVNQDNSEEGKLAVDAEGFSVYVLTLTVSQKQIVLTFDVGSGDLDLTSIKLYSTGIDNEGRITATIYPDNNSNIVLPNAIRSGFSFDGWYSGDNLIGKARATVSFNENKVLYAKWNKCEAMIGEICYSSLQTAIDNAQSNDVIVLKNDLTIQNEEHDLYKVGGKKLTIDLGGKTITCLKGNQYIIEAQNGGDLTIVNGTITSKSSDNNMLLYVTNGGKLTLGKDLKLESPYGTSSFILSRRGGTIIFDGANYNHGYHKCRPGRSPITLQGATLYFKDGVINQGDCVLVDTGDNYVNTIKISGGTFSKEVPESWLEEGYAAEKDNNKFVVKYHPVAIDPANNGQAYSSLQRAIDVAENNATFILNMDTIEDVVVPENKSIILDLNNHKITNKSNHTIINNGTLTINGNGTIDNITHAKAAIYNGVKGVLTINGGIFERSQEAGVDKDNNGGNSYYTVKNLGKITIKGGTFKNNGAYSSMFANGYYNSNEVISANNNATTPSVAPILVIDGGLFDGGLNTVKNDDYGVLTINGGEFINQAQTAFQNHNKVTINGGVFSPKNNASAIMLGRFGSSQDGPNEGIVEINTGIFNGGISLQNASKSGHKLTINGGIFEKNGTTSIFPDIELTNASINGGIFAEDPSIYVEGSHYVTANADKFIVTADEPTADNLDGNYAAKPSISVSGTGIANGSTLNDLMVDVEEIKGESETLVTEGIPSPNHNNPFKVSPLGQVKLTYKSGSQEISNVKFGAPILVKIPVKGNVQKVFIVARHGANAFGTEGLTLSKDSTCNEEGVPNNVYTGGLISVKNGYAAIYTCQASIFSANALIYHATLNSNGAKTEGTKDVYYASGTYEYYATEDDSSKLQGNKIDIPSKIGHTFMGYFSGDTVVIDANGLIKDDVFNVASNNTYIAKYAKGSHTFSYADITSGTLNPQSSVSGAYEYNDIITLKTPLVTDETDEFKEWKLLNENSEDITSSIGLKQVDDSYEFNMPNYDVVAKAIIGKKDYKITFVNYDNTLLYEKEFKHGVHPEYSGEDPEKPQTAQTGYIFTGWYLSGDEVKAKVALDTTTVTGAATYVALYEEIERGYTITFDSKGGSEVSPKTGIVYNGTGEEPAEPTRDGFTFNGWYLEGDSTAFDFENTKITGDITLIAQWNAYGVHGPFYTSANSGFNIALFAGGESAGKIDVKATLSGNAYTPSVIKNNVEGTEVEIVHIEALGGDQLFVKYPDGGKSSIKGFCSTSGCNYYKSSQWPEITEDILSAMDTTKVEGSSWVKNAATGDYKRYYELTGGFMVYVNSTEVNGYIYIPYKEFTVEYSYENAPYWTEGKPTSETYKYKDIVNVAGLPTAQGYTFTGWYFDGQITGSFKMPARNVTLTGEFLSNDSDYGYHYELETLEGSYELTGVEKISLVGKEGDAFKLPENLKTFEGFSLTGDYSNLVIRSGSNFPIKFARNTYFLGYYYNNLAGARIGHRGGNITYGKEVDIKAGPAALPGYTFKWNGYVAGDKFTMPANPLTITGEFVANTGTTYIVKHLQQNIDNDDYTVVDVENLSGTTDTDIVVNLRNDAGFKTGVYNAAKINGNGQTVVEVKYDREIYTISFDSNSGSRVNPQSIKYNGTGSIPTNAPTRTGYDFTGWYLSGTDEKFDFTGTNITGKVSLVAKWEPKIDSYKVYYHLEKLEKHSDNDDDPYNYPWRNESVIKEYSGIKVGSTIEVPQNITGYTLITEKTPIESEKCTLKGDICNYTVDYSIKDIDFYYKRKTIEITFDSDGGTAVDSITGKYESKITLPEPIRTGYDFKGWGENYLSGNYTVLGNTGFTAQWAPATGTRYTVEHYLQKLDGSYPENPSEKDSNLSGTTNNTAKAEQKEYEGFTLNETGSQLTGIITASGDLVLKLYYDRNTYDVNYEFSGNVPEGAFAPAKSGYKFEETVSVESGVLVPGYNFDGWFLDGKLTTGEFVMPATGVVLTGSFAPKRVNYQFHYEIEDLSGNFIPNGNVYVRTGRAGSLNENPKEESLLNYIRKSYPGFSLSGRMDDYRETIKGDGSTDIAIQLKRNQYNVEYAYEKAVTGASALPEKTGYKYEAPVRIAPLATASGYDFKWSGYGENDSFPMPANNVVITGVFTPRNDTPYTVAYYYQGNDGEYYLRGSKVRTGTTEDTGYVEDEDKISQDTENYVFTESGSVLTGTISGDGKLVLKVLFKGIYTVKYLPGDDQLKWSYTKTGLEYGATTPIFPYNMDWLEKPYGYVFDKWTPVIQQNVTGNIEYIAQWAPKETKYTVEYYQENLSGDDYKLIDSESLTGKTRELVTGDVINYPGFTYSGDISNQTGEVEGDGSLVLKLYYTRNSHTYTYSDPNGNPVEKIVKYGEDISTETEEYEGYELSGYTTDVPTSMPDSNLNVTPIWNLKQYTVSFDTIGGDPIEDQTYTIKSGLASLPTPVWTGYVFSGWYDSNDGKVIAITTGSTGDITLTAHWEVSEAQYKVIHYKEVRDDYDGDKFQAEDGKWYKVADVQTPLTGVANSPVSATPKTYNGFTIDDSNIGNITTGTVLADGSLELKLYYSRNTYKATFNTSGGNTIEPEEFKYYRSLTKPEDPEKTGYTFKEWQLNGTKFTEWNQVKNAGDITLDAVWTANNYTVTFNTDGASGTVATIATQYDTLFSLPNPSENELSKTGYIFTGWTTNEGGTDVKYKGGEEVSSLIASGEITLYPVWEAKEYTITWLNSDDSLIKTGLYKFDTIPELDITPVDPRINIKGIFAGWTPEVVTVSEDATYKATYTAPVGPAKYTVSWYNSNGELLDQTGVNYKDQASYSKETPTSGKDEQYHYEFTGWALSGTDVVLSELPKIESDTSFVAVYEKVLNTYKVVFEYTGANGFSVESGDYLYGTETGNLLVPTVTGYTDLYNEYTFAGWNPELVTVTGDQTYKAIYTPKEREYIVTWKVGEEETKVGYTYRSGLVVPETPTMTGYTFSSWEAQDDAPVPQNGESVEGDYTYVAKWNANTYKIEFNPNGGNGAAVYQDMTYDLTGALTGNTFQRDGYEFTGWSETENGEVKYANEQEVINLATSGIFKLYAQRSLNNYTVTYNVNSGTMPESYTGTYSVLTGIDTLVEPTRTGYVFSGWYDNEALSGDKVESIAVESTGNKEFWAKWTPITYTIVFKSNKADVTIAPITVEYDSGIILSGASITGHSIKEWNTQADGSGDVYAVGEELKNLTTTGGTTITLYAKWSSWQYTINFAGNGGEGAMSGILYTCGDETYLPNNTFEKSGYVFLGWSFNNPERDVKYADGAKVKCDTSKATEITLYAQWKINQYTITFDTNSGTEIAPITGDYGIAIEETPTNPTRTGYVFGGWDKKIPTTMPAEDITITAKWLSTEWSIDEKVSPHGEGENGKGYDTEISGYDIKYTNVSLRIPDDDEDRGGKTATWLGFKLTAPEAVTPKNSGAAYLKTYSNTKYTIAQAADETDSDGRYVVYVWMPLTDEDVKSAISGEKTEIEYTTIVSWDGNEESEKTIKATVDLKSLLIEDKDGNTVLVQTDDEGNIVDKNEYYDVTFDTNGGSSVTGQNVHYNSGVVIPTAPEKTGYQFSGWTLNGETFDFTGTKITGDITLTGAWTPVTYYIDYLPNGGVIKSGNATTYTIEDEVQLYNTAIRTGYVFKGWLDASSGVVDRIEKGTYGNQILLAQWQQVSAALAEAKSGEKKAVVSSDVTVDIDVESGAAEYTSENIPSGTLSFDTPLLTNVVNSGTIEEYSLVGIKRASTQLDVKTDELQVKTGYVATIVGGLEVYLKKITITKNASGVIETKTEKNTNTVNFSKPVALPINITTSATGVKVMVNHGEGYGLSGLSINPNTTCTNGIASDPYTGELIPVENSYAWIYTCSASKFVTYTETVKSSGGGTSGGSSSGGSGGGGGGSSKSSSSSSSSSTTPTTNTGNTTNIDLKGVVSAPNKACLNITEESKIKYSDEVLDAYAWAYANGVVTSNDVEKARVYSYITRAELAKIMVQYVAGVLKKKPVIEGNISYADVDESLGEYAGYINLAYQYQIMGINADGTPLKEFGPKSLVTRAEFASVLSRVLYGDKYNVDGSAFYSMHIDVLNQLGIIKDTNPAILEKIGWILIMLKRASKDIPNTKDVSNVEYCAITAEDEQKAAYEWALKYGITSIDDPDKARLGEELTRAEFAKMMVQYMINVLHKKPILNKDISYPDVDGSLGDLEAYIKLAYQYQIMGIHGNGQPLEEFAPNRIVTRKEFATVFSRILFGDRFNIDGPEYWTNHIDALKEISVLKDGNPALQEVRGRVMLMMYRSADDLNK